MTSGNGEQDDAMDKGLTKFGREWNASVEKASPFDAAGFEALLSAVDREEAPAAAPAPVATPAPVRRPARVLTVTGLAFAAAAAIALFALLSPGDEDLGAMLYRRSSGAQGLALEKLKAGSIIKTSGNGDAAVFSMDGSRVTVNMAPDTQVEVVSDDNIRLVKGEIWTHVRTGSGEFEVTTPDGEVEVHGTTFGVRVDDEGSYVVVAEGEIEVGIKGECVDMEPGTQAKIGRGSKQPVFEVAPADVTPPWAVELERAAAAR